MLEEFPGMIFFNKKSLESFHFVGEISGKISEDNSEEILRVISKKILFISNNPQEISEESLEIFVQF